MDDDDVDGQLPESVAEPAQVQRRNTRIKMTKARGDQWLRAQLVDPDGRRWFWGLLKECGTFEDRFAAAPNGQPDARASDHYAGQKSVGQRVWRTLAKADPAMTALMHAENDV